MTGEAAVTSARAVGNARDRARAQKGPLWLTVEPPGAMVAVAAASKHWLGYRLVYIHCWEI